MTTSICTNFQSNPMNDNNICRKCFQHRDSHPPVEAYRNEKECRRQIEDILYFSTSKEDPDGVDSIISSLIKKPPPPEEYFKVFNVYSFVRQNLTNPQLSCLSPEQKMVNIYRGVDFLLLIALPLRRPKNFEKVSKLRRSELVEVEKLEGTHDVIKKLGYTVMTKDHFEFPLEVIQAPDQTLIREIIADLRIALEEIKSYNYQKHPYPERFSEGDWAKKTSPILTELIKCPIIPENKDLKKFAVILENFKKPTAPLPEIFNFPDSQLPVRPPIPLMPRYTHYNNPPNTREDLERSYKPIVEQFPPKIDLETKIPPPVPDNMIVCPVPTCQTVFPKNSAACPKCRMCLTISSTSDSVPIEKWNCSNCTYTNTSARGRNRVCEMCPHINDTPPSNEPSHFQRILAANNEASMNPRLDPSMNPGADRSVLPGIERYLEKSMYGPRMDQPMPPHNSHRDSQMFSSYYPTSETENVPEYPQRVPNDPVPENRYHYDYVPPLTPDTYYDPRDKGYTAYPSLPPYKMIKQIIIQNPGFKDEAIRLAIQKCGINSNECARWLQTEFRDIINMLNVDVRTFHLCQSVTADTVEENYLACQGIITNVPARIQEVRKKKLEELSASHHVNEQTAIKSLEETNWDAQSASENITLLCNQHILEACRPFLWSGGMTIQDKQPDEIDPVLWEQFMLLSVNIEDMSDKVARKFLCELKIPSLIQLNLLLHLVVAEETKTKEPKDLVQAVQEISEFDAAVKFLNQECPLCFEEFTANEMIQMFFCNHMCCKSCITGHYTDVVRNAAIKKWTCFQCEEPDISQMDDPADYFGLLSNVVQAMCEPEIAGLFHHKVNEFYFSKRPEFRWCPHCHSGFLGQEGEGKLRCPQEECNQYMCYICKRKWEPEHEGVSCEEYQQWREANDRDILDKGLAARMVEEGIECPSCKFKYELARGGCMHFRCTQCPAEFCSGCFRLFKKDNCTMFASCAKKGLHAHHPRNCQYFTRDMDILKMKELLEMAGFQRDEAVQKEPVPVPVPVPVPEGAQAIPVKKKQQIYKVKVPDEHKQAVIEELKNEMGDAYAEPPQGELKIPCQIIEYKDSPDKGYEKEHCSKSSLEKDGYAGLCEKHYKEYLCGLMTKAGLDPIDVLQVTEDSIFELFAILRRNEIPFDDKMKGDQLKLLIKEKLPLEPMTFKGALQV
ncbi:hypothetical protein LOD99_15676 [Oopsacas minuta]|uniref:RBR-type E3 ubiquitin transferase n=1 Tax=Oopsacas minuta TaxID=111878 RepID=A0AAV7K9Y0_9METZ|nr:hypothetical protein LOD99_15676 [Oopsacas minuta]